MDCVVRKARQTEGRVAQLDRALASEERNLPLFKSQLIIDNSTSYTFLSIPFLIANEDIMKILLHYSQISGGNFHFPLKYHSPSLRD